MIVKGIHLDTVQVAAITVTVGTKIVKRSVANAGGRVTEFIEVSQVLKFMEPELLKQSSS